MSYQDGKIYKLICSETGNIYIGSTIQTLKIRLSDHKASTNKCVSRHLINPSIHLIKNYPCDNIKELEKEESKFIRQGNCVNKVIPDRTHAEYYIDHPDYMRDYYKKNSKKMNLYDKQYKIDNDKKLKQKIECSCGGRYSHANKSSHFKTNKHQKFINQI